MPTLTFPVYNGGGDPSTGDAHVISLGSPNTFNPIQSTGWVGRAAKTAPEVNIFLAFKVAGIPRGSVVDGVNVEFVTSIAAEGTGNVRLGYLAPDGTWEINGFASQGAAPDPPRYNLAHKFPNDGNAIPHATQDSSLTIETGILVLNSWATGDVAFSAALFPADTRIAIGSGIGGEDSVQPGIRTVFNGLFNQNGREIQALTIDSQNVGNTLNRINVYFSEQVDPARHPALVVEYTENPPVFLSTPRNVGILGSPWEYDADADPYSLGDQTAGSAIAVLYSLPGVEGIDFPTGMTIDSGTGLVTWLPVEGQQGSNPCTVRATNAGGLFVDQAFSITIADLAVRGDLVTETFPDAPTVTPSAQEVAATASAQEISTAPSAQTITATPQAQRISVTVVSGDVEVTPVPPVP